MPIATTSRPFARVYSRATDIPPSVWDGLKKNEWYTNTILPYLLKCLQREDEGYAPLEGEFWITCSTPSTSSSISSTPAALSPPPTLDLMLSCTNGPVDKYPVFIATTHPHSFLTPEFLHERIAAIVDALCQVTRPSRVYSVYSPEPIAVEFSKAWTKRTGVQREIIPYYDARVSYCTKETLVEPLAASERYRDAHIECRLASRDDLLDVSDLCYGFAFEAPPFQHTRQSSVIEGSALIARGQAWVLTVNHEIASLVAVTRNTASVATITKVYTSPAFRGHKYAEILVRHVTKEFLRQRDVVMLYVGWDNPAAKVYGRVGYVGLLGEDGIIREQGVKGNKVKGVDRWLEIGFDQSRVELGFW